MIPTDRTSKTGSDSTGSTVGVGSRSSTRRSFWLSTLVDPRDDEGNVHISPEPGLGYGINWDYIKANVVD
jgi:hypothetical protein